MKNDYNLEFLRNKIEQAGTALCSLYLPGCTDTSYIIHTESVDEDGHINFNLVDSLPNIASQYLKSFGIKLLYYKKGLGFYLNIQAAATAIPVITNENSTVNKKLNVKPKILSAEYHEGVKDIKMQQQYHGFMHSFRKKISQVAAGIFWM